MSGLTPNGDLKRPLKNRSAADDEVLRLAARATSAGNPLRGAGDGQISRMKL